ncbi:hypothetical protein WJX84_003658 [Apatococcus fuscideae]|uniref:NLE domain-containing protein n=1 Tax=Apatococcus fuscideae TaxID=2026836 RepID=A0AAW1TDA8_9CHLO
MAGASEPPAKIRRVEEAPANVILQFESESGELTGPLLDVPDTVTPQQLEVLLNNLLQQGDPLPYAFFLQDHELAGQLGTHLQKQQVSIEAALRVVYRPQALFRVRPVTRCTASMPGHAEAVLAVAFSPSGKQLASGSGDTSLRLWDLSTQTSEHTCQGHRNWVLAVSWSPDGLVVASADMDGVIWLWQSSNGETLGCCRGHRKWVTSLAWEPAHASLPSRRFCSGSKDTTLRVWNTITRQCQFSMSSHTMAITCVAWGGEGLLYSSARDCSINVWDAQDGKLVRSLPGHGHWVNTLALSTEHALRSGAHDEHGITPDELEEAKKVAKKRYAEASKGQAEKLVSGSDDNTLYMWQPSTSKKSLARMTGHMQLVNQVQFSPDGRWVASASFDKAIKLWNGADGTFVANFRGHVGAVYQIAWSSDSRLLVSGSKDSTLKVWDVKTRKLKLDLPGHADEVFAVDWSPDGSAVASGGKDKILKLWRH